MVRPFSDDDLDAAAALLARRHDRHRAVEPLLPADVDFRAEVESAWRQPGASGAVCESGYLIGAPREDREMGPDVSVEAAGHAVAEAETVRDLYALAAARWVDEGLTRHYVRVPAPDAPLVDAWFRLGFGQYHATGIRELPADTGWPDGVREGDEDDLDAILALAALLREHHTLAPAFSPGTPRESPEELRRAVLETIASPGATELVAEAGGRIVGNFVVRPVEAWPAHMGLVRPVRAAVLAWAVTLPEVRGTGTGLALTEASYAWARSRGYESIVTDWRVTNLLSSRFWPRRGFRTTFLRLYRSIP